MQILLTKTILVLIVSVEFPKSLVNKTVLFWSTDFHLLTNRFLTTQNHWKPLNTIERKKADFSALSKLLKNVEKCWKSARVERVTESKLTLQNQKCVLISFQNKKELLTKPFMELTAGIEPATSSLPWMRSTYWAMKASKKLSLA